MSYSALLLTAADRSKNIAYFSDKYKKEFLFETTREGRETKGGSPSALGHFPADIWRFGQLAFGLLAPGTFPGQDFWLLDIRRWDIWRLEIWRPRQMAAKTIGGRDNPCPGRLAS